MLDEAADPKATDLLHSLMDIARVMNVLDDGVKATLSKLDTLGTTLNQRFLLFQTALRELRANAQEISSEQSKTRSEIMSRIDRLQETVELVRDDARVNWATADTAINRARNSRQDIDDLQKQIGAMERRYQTLAALVDGLRNPEIKKPDNL